MIYSNVKYDGSYARLYCIGNFVDEIVAVDLDTGPSNSWYLQSFACRSFDYQIYFIHGDYKVCVQF